MHSLEITYSEDPELYDALIEKRAAYLAFKRMMTGGHYTPKQEQSIEARYDAASLKVKTLRKNRFSSSASSPERTPAGNAATSKPAAE